MRNDTLEQETTLQNDIPIQLEVQVPKPGKITTVTEQDIYSPVIINITTGWRDTLQEGFYQIQDYYEEELNPKIYINDRIKYSYYLTYDLFNNNNPVQKNFSLYDQYYENDIWIEKDYILHNPETDTYFIQIAEGLQMIPIWLPQIEVYMDTKSADYQEDKGFEFQALLSFDFEYQNKYPNM